MSEVLASHNVQLTGVAVALPRSASILNTLPMDKPDLWRIN